MKSQGAMAIEWEWGAIPPLLAVPSYFLSFDADFPAGRIGSAAYRGSDHLALSLPKQGGPSTSLKQDTAEPMA